MKKLQSILTIIFLVLVSGCVHKNILYNDTFKIEYQEDLFKKGIFLFVVDGNLTASGQINGCESLVQLISKEDINKLLLIINESGFLKLKKSYGNKYGNLLFSGNSITIYDGKLLYNA
jgi:hypothetical protein